MPRPRKRDSRITSPAENLRKKPRSGLSFSSPQIGFNRSQAQHQYPRLQTDVQGRLVIRLVPRDRTFSADANGTNGGPKGFQATNHCFTTKRTQERGSGNSPRHARDLGYQFRPRRRHTLSTTGRKSSASLLLTNSWPSLVRWQSSCSMAVPNNFLSTKYC